MNNVGRKAKPTRFDFVFCWLCYGFYFEMRVNERPTLSGFAPLSLQCSQE
jgi:hypothetical protein